jgi:hypothetical protein
MIFISYSWADAPAAHWLYHRLAQLSIKTWIDFERLDLQDCIESQLDAAIQSATLIMLVDSPAARNSKWVRFEMTCAERKRTPVMRLSALSGNALRAVMCARGL